MAAEEHEAAQRERELRARARAERDADPYEVARIIVLNRLNAAPRTRAELRETLDKRGVPDEVSDRVLDRMEEVDLIDDAAYAKAWVTSRQSGRGLARRALRQELHRKGIDAETAGEALSLVDDAAELDAARELVRRKVCGVETLPRDKQVRRLVGMLARKGYSAGLAYRVVNEALDGTLEEGHDQFA